MSEGLVAIDSEGRVTMINGAAMELLSIWKPPVGHRFAEAARIPALDELVRESRDSPASTSLSLSHGSVTRHLIARARPLDSSGGVVVVMLDVTELRRLETIRKDFVANVSHELRTPVTVIRATSEMLLDGALAEPARAEQFVGAMHRNAGNKNAQLTPVRHASVPYAHSF